MLRFLRSLPLILMILLFPLHSKAEEDGFSGRWEQITSNAGMCAKCSLTITRQGRYLIVSASNGWNAMAMTDRNGPADYATGKGRWKISSRATYSNKSFDIAIGVRGKKLLMMMIVEADDGAKRVVKAYFSKKPPTIPFNRT